MSRRNLYEIKAQHISMQTWEISTKVFAKNPEKALQRFRKYYSEFNWLIKDIEVVYDHERKD